jgi:hypothetical protein
VRIPRGPRALLIFPLILAAIAAIEAQTAPPDPAAILGAAREALGGDKRLSAVKTFVATGRTQQVRGDNLVPIEFEIAVELPDKYVRKDEIPAQESGPTSVGFMGESLIQVPPQTAPAGRPGGPPPPTSEQLEAARRTRVVGVKQDFARLALGMFAGSFAGYPLTFTYVGQAEAPQGKADVLEAKGAPNLTMRFFIAQSTHQPIMISWQGPAPGGGRGAAPGRGPAPPPAAAPGGPPPENRIYFADYRDVDGMQWPFRLRRALGADTVEETTFDRFRVNTKIDPKKFQP